MQDVDRIAEANQHLDRRARQRHAAALAQQELTPEAIAAEEERQRVHAAITDGIIRNPEREVYGTETVGEVLAEYPPSLAERLAAAVEPVLAGEDPDEELVEAPIGIGRSMFQWILVPSDDVENEDGLQLALQLQVDEQPPVGFVAEITAEQLAEWAVGKGLQGNRTEHKKFVAALFQQAIGVGATETANGLIYTLEQLMLGDEPAAPELTE